jgi:alkaline phosphatase D
VLASCSHYEQGWFTAYRRLAEEQPDLVVHLGDYQYEYAAGQTTSGRVREHVGPETVTLANYRQRYAQYKTDPDLQVAGGNSEALAARPRGRAPIRR